MNIACFSVAAMDGFPQVNEQHAGGNALNQSIRFRQLGHRTAFLGAIGTDPAGDRLAGLLAAEGVDCTHLRRPEGKTACNLILNDDTGERTGVEGAWQDGVYASFRMAPSDWTFLENFDIWSTHADCPDYDEALRKRPSDKWMAVDFLHLLKPEVLERTLAPRTICYIGGTADMADTLSRIAATKEGILVLTLGAEGSMAFQGRDQWCQPALPVERVIDTTGCGDAFQAGFTTEYVKTGNVQAALLAGAGLGRIATQSRGGVPWKGI